MKLMIAVLFLIVSLMECKAQVQYRTKTITSGKKLYDLRAQRRAGTLFQLLGGVAITYTAIGLNNYEDVKKTPIKNKTPYLLASSGIFMFGCVIKIDAKRRLKK